MDTRTTHPSRGAINSDAPSPASPKWTLPACADRWFIHTDQTSSFNELTAADRNWAKGSYTSIDLSYEIRKVINTLPAVTAIRVERDWHKALSKGEREIFLNHLADLRDLLANDILVLPKHLQGLVTTKFYGQKSPRKREQIRTQIEKVKRSLIGSVHLFSECGIDLSADRKEIYSASVHLSRLGEDMMEKIESNDVHPSLHLVSGKANSTQSIMRETSVVADSSSFAAMLEKLGFNSSMSERQLRERVTEPSFWRKKIAQALREHRARAWLLTSPASINWASTDGISERRQIMKFQTHWSEIMCLVNRDGVVIDAPTPEKTAARQHAEFLARSRAVASNSLDDKAYLFTQTLPSNFHATRSLVSRFGTVQRITNPDYDDELNPRVGHKWLNRQWTRLRKEIWKINARRQKAGLEKIPLDYILVAQPHQDQTPHWHTIVFGGEHIELIKELFIKHFFMPDNQIDESAATEQRPLLRTDEWSGFRNQYLDKNRLDIKELSGDGGGRAAAMAYVARSIRFCTGCQNQADQIDDSEWVATKQWASEYKIRRFRTSVTGVTAWRLIRRLNEMQNLDVKVAADNGDYAQYLRLFKAGNGSILKRNLTNKYGEDVSKSVGISYAGISYLHHNKFEPMRKSDTSKGMTMLSKDGADWRDATLYAGGVTVTTMNQVAATPTSKLPFMSDIEIENVHQHNSNIHHLFSQRTGKSQR